MRFLAVFICSLALCIVLDASAGTDDWHYGIVVLSRSDDCVAKIQHIQNFSRKQRCKKAVSLFKMANEKSVYEFSRNLRRSSLSQDIVIEKGLWIGNAARIRYRTDSALLALRNLPEVVTAFEDIENFKILETTASADAMDVVWGVQRIGAPSCWSIGYAGRNVLVAVLDSGIRYTHNDLENRMWHNAGEIPDNGTDDDGNGYIDDYYGYDTYNGDGNPWDDNIPSYHGTHCAGTVAGDGTGGTQTGVAPEAGLMAVKVIGSSGLGSASALAEGIQYALENGADVLSMSLGWPNPDNEIKNYMRPIMEDVLSAGVIAAVAAGNDGGEYSAPQDISAPGDCPVSGHGASGQFPGVAAADRRQQSAGHGAQAQAARRSAPGRIGGPGRAACQGCARPGCQPRRIRQHHPALHGPAFAGAPHHPDAQGDRRDELCRDR